MLLRYNGYELELMQINECRREAIYDPVAHIDYLYTEWTLDVLADLNLDATTYRLPGAVPISPQPNSRSGSSTITDNTLRAAMLVPRQHLLIAFPSNPTMSLAGTAITSSGSSSAAAESDYETWISVPYAGRVVDPNNGPLPLGFHVVKAVGNANIMVRFIIKFHTNDCFAFCGPSPPAVLSHRFVMTHDVDLNRYTTRLISGNVVFRPDLVTTLTTLDPAVTAVSTYPDSIRNSLFFPVPPNFQRMHVHVAQSADGTMLRYEVTDVEKGSNFNAFATKATYVEMEHSQSLVIAPGLIGAGMGALNQYYNLKINRGWLNDIREKEKQAQLHKKNAVPNPNPTPQTGGTP